MGGNLEHRWKLREDWQNNPIICLRENAQSPSLGLKYNEQRVENSSLRPVLEKEVALAGNRVETFGDTSVASHSIDPIFQPEQVAICSRSGNTSCRRIAYAYALGAGCCEVLWNARERIAPAHSWVDKPGKGEAPQPPLDPRQAWGRSAIIGVEAHGARGLVPEHVHGSGILSENARIPTQRGKALWDRKGRKPKQDLAQTSRNCLPARRKVDVAFFPCHFLPPHDSGEGRQGKEAQGLMVPVNGTRVGRGGSFLNLNATGTAGFDQSAMSRPKGIERRASRMLLDETSTAKGSELDCSKLSEYVKRSAPRVSEWCAVLSDGKSRGGLATWEVWLRRSGGRESKASDSERLLCVVPGVTTVLAFRGELPLLPLRRRDLLDKSRISVARKRWKTSMVLHGRFKSLAGKISSDKDPMSILLVASVDKGNPGLRGRCAEGWFWHVASRVQYIKYPSSVAHECMSTRCTHEWGYPIGTEFRKPPFSRPEEGGCQIFVRYGVIGLRLPGPESAPVHWYHNKWRRGVGKLNQKFGKLGSVKVENYAKEEIK
ncbi:hypothetical protein H4582DRAFT_2055348 [Lactarius indigo]|nr:hypothetical protein H4582DRAFT_2055348 [Lactarius indigo]